MLGDQQQHHLANSSGDRAHPLNHVPRIAVVLDHLAEPANLPFYATEAEEKVLLLLWQTLQEELLSRIS